MALTATAPQVPADPDPWPRWMISSDSHVIEPPDLWSERVPAAIRDRAPRVVREDDADWWYVEGAKTMSFLGIQTGFRFDRPPEQLRTRARLEDVRPAVFDPLEYVAENEQDGIWASVLYPSQGMIVYRAPTTAVVEASCAAYNDWLAEFCGAAPGRLAGIAMLSVDDPAVAAAELARSREKGLVGAMIPAALTGSSYRDERYDVLWAAAQDHAMPLGLHVATDRVRPNAPPEALDVGSANENVFINKDGAIRQALADLILSGVFERFPRLIVGAIEFETGWIPYFLEQMDYTYAQRPVRPSWHRFPAGILPSDFFRTNVFASFQEDSVGVRTLDLIGEANLLWGSDYPHTESTFPRSRDLLAPIFARAGLDAAQVERLVVTNTATRYGLALPPVSWNRVDLVVRGATIVDGTGAPSFRGDLAVHRGDIVAIGAEASGAARDAADVLDGEGCIVAPGFVDVHTHYDPQVTWDPWLSPSSQLGVTSAVAGNCGFSVAPCRPTQRPLLMRTLEAVEDIPLAAMTSAIDWSFETYGEYLQFLARRGLGINFGGYVGHTALRLYVLGDEAYERKATDDEIRTMCEVLRSSIDAGALGFSTDRAGFIPGDGGRPVPSVVASAQETEALCMAVAEAGRGIVHIAPGDVFEWIYDLAPRYGRTLTWSAILAYPPGKPVNWTDKLGLHRRCVDADRGLDVHPQVTSRVLSFSFTLENPITLYQIPAFGDLGKAGPEARLRAFADPEWRRQAREQTRAVAWRAMIVSETDDADVRGLSVAEIATRRGVDPLDAVVDLAIGEGLRTRLRVDAANIDPAAVAELLTGPNCILGLTDAGAHVAQVCDAVMPVHFLAEWVRDRSLLSVEAGIRKTSGEIADVLGLRNRGVIRTGARADLVVLEWDRLGTGPARRRRDLPGGAERLVTDEPTGLRHVVVNGTPIRRDHAPVPDAPLAGQLLEPKRYG